jgi:hypothetical protein
MTPMSYTRGPLNTPGNSRASSLSAWRATSTTRSRPDSRDGRGSHNEHEQQADLRRRVVALRTFDGAYVALGCGAGKA